MEKEVKQGRVRDTGGTGEETTNWGQEQEQGDSAQGETKEWSRRGAREWGAQSRAEEGLAFLCPPGFWFLCSGSRMSQLRCSFHSATSARVWQASFTLYSLSPGFSKLSQNRNRNRRE